MISRNRKTKWIKGTTLELNTRSLSAKLSITHYKKYQLSLFFLINISAPALANNRHKISTNQQ